MTTPLDFGFARPDLVVLSFYKIFGFPTALGALLIRKDSCSLLQKTYFGGGAVKTLVFDEDWAVLNTDLDHGLDTLLWLSGKQTTHRILTSRPKLGTPPFLEIKYLDFALDYA